MSEDVRRRSPARAGKAERAPAVLPYDLRIKQQKFKDVYVERPGEGEKYNFFDIEGNKIKIGYDTEKETSERAFGSLVEVGDGTYALATDRTVDEKLALDMQKPLIAALKEKKGILVSDYVITATVPYDRLN